MLFYKNVGVFILITLLCGCAENARSIQPVVSFVIVGEKLNLHAEEILTLASNMSETYKMKFHQSTYNNGDISFQATRNSWFYHHSLTPGNDADFRIYLGQQKIIISVVGPPDHDIVHALIAEWHKVLDQSGISYGKVIRQAYLGEKVTPKDHPMRKAMNS